MAGSPNPFSEPSLIDARYFTPFARVAQVTRTQRGILAEVDGELLRIDVIRDDIVRLKISRGRSFDEAPSFAVCADLDAVATAFTIDEGDGAVRVRTSRMVVTLSHDPFRLDAHRADGSAIFETHQDRDGNHWTYATLNDDFVVRRTCRQEDAFFGLGEKTGRFNRKGRHFTLWNTDVLSPTAAGEFTAGKAQDDPRGDNTSTEFDPYYVSIPFFYHMSHEGDRMSGFFVDNGYRGHFEFTRRHDYSFHLAGGQYT